MPGQDTPVRISDGSGRLFPPRAKPAPWLDALQTYDTGATAREANMNEQANTWLFDKLKGLGNSAKTSGNYVGEMGIPGAPPEDRSYAGPRIMPTPPPMFRQSTPDIGVSSPYDTPNMGRVQGQGIEGPTMYMERTPGGKGMSGNEWALANQGESPAIKALSEAYTPTEELFRKAASPDRLQIQGDDTDWTGYSRGMSVGRAPGSQAYAQNQLKNRVGDDEFARLLGQKEQEIERTAQAKLSPTVQTEAQLGAERAAIPAKLTAQAQGLSGLFGLRRAQETAAGQIEGRRAARDGAATAALARAYADLSVPKYTENDDERTAREGRAAEIKEMLDALQDGQFFLSDLVGEDEVDALLETIGYEDELDLGY